MNGVNRVILIGNVGKDPELKYTQGGAAVLTLKVATNESYIDKAGVKQKRTEWHTVVLWGKRAEGVGRFIEKGHLVHVEGSLQTRSYEDRTGVKRYSTEVKASDVNVLTSKHASERDIERAEAPKADDYADEDLDAPF